MPDFPLIDTHVHLYDWASIRYPWMVGLATLEAPHRSEEFTAAIGGVAVDKLVFVEISAAEEQAMDEVAWVAEAAKRDRRIQAMVVTVPLEKGRAAEAEIAAVARQPLVRDIRRLIQGHVDEPGWCLRPQFLEGVRLVGDYGLGFDIGIRHPQLKDAIELVRRFPDMRFTLDHMAKPGIKDGLLDPWRADLRALSAFPNVLCKISGVVTEANRETWTYDEVAPYIAHAIDCFGFDRVMFGGDWPVMELATRYPAWVAIVDRVTAGAPSADLRKLYRDNAIRHYRL